jgi:hypothetical protein
LAQPPLKKPQALRTADRFYVVTVRIEYEGSIIAGRITFAGVTKLRRTVIAPARLHGDRVKCVDLRTA